MHKRSVRRFAVVTGAALISGATVVPAMASLSIGSSSGLLNESSIGNDIVPSALPALPASGAFVSPILGNNWAVVGQNSLLPAGVGSITGLVPSTSSLTALALVGLGAAGSVTALPNTVVALVSGPTSPVNTVVATATGALKILNPDTLAVGGILGSM